MTAKVLVNVTQPCTTKYYKTEKRPCLTKTSSTALNFRDYSLRNFRNRLGCVDHEIRCFEIGFVSRGKEFTDGILELEKSKILALK